MSSVPVIFVLNYKNINKIDPPALSIIIKKVALVIWRPIKYFVYQPDDLFDYNVNFKFVFFSPDRITKIHLKTFRKLIEL